MFCAPYSWFSVSRSSLATHSGVIEGSRRDVGVAQDIRWLVCYACCFEISDRQRIGGAASGANQTRWHYSMSTYKPFVDIYDAAFTAIAGIEEHGLAYGRSTL